MVRNRVCNDSFKLEIDQNRWLDIVSVMILLFWKLTRKVVRYRVCYERFFFEIDQNRWLDIVSVMIVLYWKLTRTDG